MIGEATRELLSYRDREDCYTVPFAKVRDLQIAALNEHLNDRIARIKLVALRAEQGAVREIRDFADIVPLLLPHTAYKSYPEAFLIEERWDKLTRWLGTVSAYPTDNVDLDGITDVDHWIARLEEAGHFVSCSSGTTGKSAMLVASHDDMVWTAQDSVVASAWGANTPPARDRYVFSMAPIAAVPRNHAIMEGLHRAFGVPGSDLFRYPIPPITVGSITRMIALRKAIAEGTARPAEIAEYQATGEARERALDEAVGITVEALLKVRGEKLYLTGLWGNLHKVAAAMRDRGLSRSDFNPENLLYVGGGLKREQLPGDYAEFVRETFNIDPRRNFQLYGMQELGSNMVRCHEGGRYHIPPWMVCLPLNKEGDALLPVGQGPIECRGGFFDLSMDGRWGGVISGDRIEVSFEPCKCGAATPSVRDNVVRYADIEGDDKIGCAGTIEAYVRGMS